MRVLFTHSYFLHLDPKQEKAAKPYPPLAPLYAAALLRENGYTVSMADMQVSSGPHELEFFVSEFKPDVLVIYDDSFNYLSKMCLTNMREAVFQMQQYAGSLKLPVIVSSSDATDHAAEYLAQGADYIIYGEAEFTLLELLSAMVRGQDTSNVAGLMYYNGHKLIKTAVRSVMKDPDVLPAPAWDLADLDFYRGIWTASHGYFSINMVSTRGCPYKCNWCAKPVYGNRYTAHSAVRVVDEIEMLHTQYGVDHIWFADDIFGLKPGFIRDFSQEIQRRGIRISYKIQSRADLLLEADTVHYLAASGCDEVWMGAESGSQKILDAMDKGITTEQISEATALLHKAGIKPCFFLQFGYMGENIEDVRMTIRMMDQLRPADIGVSVSYPLPGTKFYESVKSDMQQKQNWKDSDDLDLMFESTYSPAFYRYLQKYVHYRFRSTQVLDDLSGMVLNTRVFKLPYYIYRRAFYRRKLKAVSAGIAAL